MKISINTIIYDLVHDGKSVYLPKIGVVYIKDNVLCYSLTHENICTYSILEALTDRFKINYDTAYKRYEYWRNAVSVYKDNCNIIRIERLIWIIFDGNNNYYYLSDCSVKADLECEV